MKPAVGFGLGAVGGGAGALLKQWMNSRSDSSLKAKGIVSADRMVYKDIAQDKWQRGEVPDFGDIAAADGVAEMNPEAKTGHLDKLRAAPIAAGRGSR